MNSCMIKAMAKANIIPGLTSGEPKYMLSSETKMKVKIKATENTVESFEIYNCDTDGQTQYMGGTNSDGAVTFKVRISAPSIFVTMSATGNMVGSEWSSKSLTVGYNLPSSYSEFTIDQKSDYLDVSGIVDSGTLGTLDSNDVQIYSRAQLIGNSAKTYALGDGSVRFSVGGNSATATNWDGDTKVIGSGPTTYDSAVSSATLPSIPTTRASQFTATETWDCAMPSDALNMESVGGNAGLMTDVQACMADFQ